MAIIKRIRSLKGVGILADQSAQNATAGFLRYNLIYGFNGSGKSTLSRLFACLELGQQHDQMPEACSFEVEMDDDTIYGSPDALSGLEGKVCVFNTNFIERNLRWETGEATSIFYISEEQGGAAAKLKEKQTALSGRKETSTAKSKTAKASANALGSHKTQRARTISQALHLVGRRYEAPHLQSDYDQLKTIRHDVVTEEVLNELQDVVRQAAPLPSLATIQDPLSETTNVVEHSRSIAELSIGKSALEEIEQHPDMVPWLKEGYEYHASHDLPNCLLCSNTLTQDRKAQLAISLDDRLSRLMDELGNAQSAVQTAKIALISKNGWPAANDIDGSLRTTFNSAVSEFDSASQPVEAVVWEAERIVEQRLARPTLSVPHSLPEMTEVHTVIENLRLRLEDVNKIIKRHNAAAEDFASSQQVARERIKKHFIAESLAVYLELKDDAHKTQEEADLIASEVSQLENEIAELSMKVRAHGPAADQITKLVRLYLGHGELTVFPADEGYELHRYGKLVKGAPSEGEKTAIALCYFLSTLEADGRNIKDLILVIDDPISSLDSKAMNYAATLIRTSVDPAAQVFILTHNQHYMNEFKKRWRNRVKPPKDKPATAAFLYMDVSLSEKSDRREGRLIEMPSHLRGHDSEYHFLCSKVLQFEASAAGHYDYWFIMPHLIRRVLEVFLGFKEPGSHRIDQRLDELIKKLPNLDPVRMKALERLVQVESHSDSLDDLIAHSSMTIEETRDANSALLLLMAEADGRHTELIRSQCKP